MSTVESRSERRPIASVQRVSDDLTWLEQHARKSGAGPEQLVRLRYASALVRNVIRPYLEDRSPSPLHVAVVGGAGAGKSTIANFLAGRRVAESNPQAGFTRHPVAFLDAGSRADWSAHVGFLGPLQRLMEPAPSSLDEDVYQVRTVDHADGDLHVLDRFVVWDCPDMTTWAAGDYIDRLAEVAALADVVVYVASDERYNDEIPTQFLRMLVESGKFAVVCLLKMHEQKQQEFIDHFRSEVLRPMRAEHVPVLTVPYLSAEDLNSLGPAARRFQIPLLNQLKVFTADSAATRRRNVQAAASYLLSQCESLLAPARSELAAVSEWRSHVQRGASEFAQRYRKEYLSGERFHRFDAALLRLLELLELPGVGRVVSNTLWVLRTPYRLARKYIGQAIRRPEAPPAPERPVMESGIRGWLDALRTEAAKRGEDHPLWKHIDQGFDHGLYEQALEKFAVMFRNFAAEQAEEADRTARAIFEELERDPAKLNALRGVKFAFEAGAITLAVASFGLAWWDLITAPIAAAVTQHLIELLGKSYIEGEKEKARERQQAMMVEHVCRPMEQWLAQWPMSEGSAFARLQEVLTRLPSDLKQVEGAVRQKG